MPNFPVPSHAVLRRSLPLMINNQSLNKLRTSRLLDASAARYRHPSSNPFARRSFQPQHISAMPILSTLFQLAKRHLELSLILFQKLLKGWNLIDTTAAFTDCATVILNIYSEILENNADDEVSAHKRVYDAVVARKCAMHNWKALGRSWCDNLLHPMLLRPGRKRNLNNIAIPFAFQIPTIEVTRACIQQAKSRSKRSHDKVALRERYLSAMSGLPDLSRITDFIVHGRLSRIPRTGFLQTSSMQAAHIIPFSFNKFRNPAEQLLASLTWDMLRAWTGIRPEDLRGRQINCPSNQIYLNATEHSMFDTFQIGFEERPNFPDSYLIKSNLEGVGILPHIVTFRNFRDSGVDAPNPRFLKAHLAIGKVFSSSGYANH